LLVSDILFFFFPSFLQDMELRRQRRYTLMITGGLLHRSVLRSCAFS
jgi:hypothetical protein